MCERLGISTSRLRQVAIVLRLGDPDFQAQISRALPVGLVGIDDAIAVGVLEVIGNAVPIGVDGIAVGVGSNYVVPDIDD